MSAKIRLDAQYVAQLAETIGLKKQDSGERLDVGETIFLAQQLEHVIATVYETRYAEFMALKLIPVDTSVPVGAASYSYYMWDSFGMAEIIHDYAHDLPMVGRKATKTTQSIRMIGDAFGYSLDDLQSAIFAKVPLQSDLAMVARRMIELKIDDLAATGSAVDGLQGFVNNANVTLVPAINGTWATASALEILEDLNELTFSIPNVSRQLFKPNTLVFDQASWQIVNRPMSADNTDTILSTFMKNNPYITNAEVWWKLDTANAAGTGPRIIAYARTPEVVSLVLPAGFTQQPPQAKGLGFEVPCWAKIGGISIKYALGIAYMDP